MHGTSTRIDGVKRRTGDTREPILRSRSSKRRDSGVLLKKTRITRMIFLLIVLIFASALSWIDYRLHARLPFGVPTAFRSSATVLHDLARRLPAWLLPASFEVSHPVSDEPRELRDLATLHSGASIVMPLTTATYRIVEPWSAHYYRKAFESIFQPDFSLSGSPNSTISINTSANTCWPFIGVHGTVVIRLSEPRQIVSASVVFTSSRRLHAQVGVPKGFRLWGLISDSRRGLLPSSCLTPSGLFAPNLVPLLDEQVGNVTPVLLSEWSDETASSSETIIPPSPCAVPLDLVVFELRGSRHDTPFTCINRLELLATPIDRLTDNTHHNARMSSISARNDSARGYLRPLRTGDFAQQNEVPLHLTRADYHVGRGEHVCINSIQVRADDSKFFVGACHAVISWDSVTNTATIKDRSMKGTWVNGVQLPVHGVSELPENAVIWLGPMDHDLSCGLVFEGALSRIYRKQIAPLLRNYPQGFDVQPVNITVHSAGPSHFVIGE
ncbi:hypothetical protein PENSPDRAFT_687937 [Peniophora sp. CONT]|nr:hypothetical protein PENSPDRAFT_687937 [Peniophora sp. CONT]